MYYNIFKLKTFFCLAVHGGWSSWKQSSTCSVTCGGGQQWVTRTCTNPAPGHGGNACSGKDKDSRTCNSNPCAGKFNDVRAHVWVCVCVLACVRVCVRACVRGSDITTSVIVFKMCKCRGILTFSKAYDLYWCLRGVGMHACVRGCVCVWSNPVMSDHSFL